MTDADVELEPAQELVPHGQPGPTTPGRSSGRSRGGGGSFDGYSRRDRILLSIATGVAGAVAFAGAAMVTDSQVDEGEDAVTVTNDSQATPVLVPASSATGFAAVGGTYGTTEWALGTQEAVLGAWGAVTPGPEGEVVATVEGDWLLGDPRSMDPGAPVFSDPCAADDGADAQEGTGVVPCPSDDAAPGVILEGRDAPPNEIEVVAFPYADVEAARACDFSEAADDDLPLVVVTANPGEVQVVVGEDEAVEVESSDEERDDWDEWMARPVGVRPRSSFVAHCLTVPRPEGAGLVQVRATASDDSDELVSADTWVGTLDEGGAPISITPIDSTMARVDVALGDGRGEAAVRAVPRSLLGGITSCDRVDDDVVAAAQGWRRGATALAGSGSDPSRPWTEDLPRVQRTTVALWEGEANLVCVGVEDGVTTAAAELWVTPPDARRLVLGVTQVQAQAPVPAPITVTAQLVELGWTPCTVQIAIAGTGISSPGSAGVMCSSGGDIGPLDGGGSVAELAVQVGDGTVHRGRIVLSARPGTGSAPDDEEPYRLPIARPDLAGALCVPGAEEPGCEPADATNILGTIVITARWNDGAAGEAAWSVSSTPG
jgi:hypothetical protein